MCFSISPSVEKTKARMEGKTERLKIYLQLVNTQSCIQVNYAEEIKSRSPAHVRVCVCFRWFSREILDREGVSWHVLTNLCARVQVFPRWSVAKGNRSLSFKDPWVIFWAAPVGGLRSSLRARPLARSASWRSGPLPGRRLGPGRKGGQEQQ